MAKTAKPNTEGRKANAAQPLGSRQGLVSDKGTEKTGRAATRKAGPEGGEAAAAALGRTFKR